MTTLTNAIKEEKEMSLVFVYSKKHENIKYEEEEEEDEEKKEKDEEDDIVFCCDRCNKAIIRNSKAHDECFTINDNDWYCGDCRQDDDE